MICLDASVAVKWLVEENDSDKAEALLNQSLVRAEPMIAPALIVSEVANTVHQRRRRGEFGLERARSLLEQFLAVPIGLHTPDGTHDRALVLSERFGLPAVYDAYYVALGEHFGATVWTADERLWRALGNQLGFVRRLADYVTGSAAR